MIPPVEENRSINKITMKNVSANGHERHRCDVYDRERERLLQRCPARLPAMSAARVRDAKGLHFRPVR
jgi:hypothetical protein